MSANNIGGLAVMTDYFRLDSIFTVFDLSALPEFAAVGLTVLSGLGAGMLSMLAVMIFVDFVGGRLDWWDDSYSLKNWLKGPVTAVGST